MEKTTLICKLILILVLIASFQIYLVTGEAYADSQAWPISPSNGPESYVPGNKITFSWGSSIAPRSGYRFSSYKICVHVASWNYWDMFEGEWNCYWYPENVNSTTFGDSPYVFPNDGSTVSWYVYALDYLIADCSKYPSGYPCGLCNGSLATCTNLTVWSFINGPHPVPAKPVLSLPSDYATTSGPNITFSWNSTTYAEKYHIQVFDQNGALFDENSNLTTLSKTFSNFGNNESNYTWQVRAGNGASGYGPFSDTRHFTNYPNQPPAQPVLSNPYNGDLQHNSGTTVNFAWNAAARAKDYYLEVFDDTGALFASRTITGGAVAASVSNFGDDGRTYTWRVTARNTYNINIVGSTASDTWSFVNVSSRPPDKPVLSWPGNGTNEAGTSICFAWEETARATDYYLEVFDENNTRIVEASIDNELGYCDSSFKDDGSIYTWQVTANNLAGPTTSNPLWSFTNGNATCTPSVGTGTGVLGDSRSLNTCQLTSTKYYLKDSSRIPPAGYQQMVIQTEDAQVVDRGEPMHQIMEHDGAENVWTDSCVLADGLAGQCAGVDAHFYAGQVYDYLHMQYLNKNWMLSYDNNNGPMITVINSPIAPTNNAQWNGNGEVLVGLSVKDLVSNVIPPPYSGSLSILGHEWGHGVDEYARKDHADSTDNTHPNEGDVIEEAFADWMGITIERFYGGTSWTMLNGINPGRNLADPTASISRKPNWGVSGQPVIYLTDPRWGNLGNCKNIGDKSNPEYDDSCYRHWDNGPANKMFYLLSVGTQAGNGGPFNGVTVQPLGIDTAIDIAFKADIKFWPKNATFKDAFDGMVNAAEDSYGANEANQVQNAWAAVGVTSLPMINTSVYPVMMTGSAGTTSGSGSYAWGASATVTATPAQDYVFVNWTEGGAQVSTSANYSFTVQGSRDLVANFAKNVQTINAPPSLPYFGNYDIGESQTGVVSVKNSGSPQLTIQSAYITGNADFSISSGNDGCSGRALGYNQTCTIRVTFAPTSVGSKSATLKILSNDPNGPSSTSLTGGGVAQATITATAGSGGTISPTVAYVVSHGTQTFTIASNIGYHIVDVKVDNVSKGAIASYTFSNVIGDHTITASFAINTYTITATAGPGGAIFPSGGVTVNYGANQTFTITPNPGYHIADVVADVVSRGAITSYPFTNVTANHSITASFAANSSNAFIITAMSGTGGTITPSGAVPVSLGTGQTFTITPNSGYHTMDVQVDGVSQGTITSYPFNNVNNDHKITASFSNQAEPSQPSNFNATAVSTTQINLSWTDSVNETSYMIERKTGAAGTYAQIATVGANLTSYADTGLTPNTSYFYRVRAHNGSGYSAYSNAAYATTLCNLTAVKSASGTGTGIVTSSPAGINCGSDCTEQYLPGTQVTLTATATSDSYFAGWSGGGCSGTTTTCSVTMNSADITVTATFNKRPLLTVTKNVTGNGTGTVTSSPAGINCGSDCTEQYLPGTQVILTATATSDSYFAGWSGGGCSGTTTICVVTMNLDGSVTAKFNIKPPVADFSASTNAGVIPFVPVTFTDKSLYAQTWLWDFGDGTTSTQQNPPTHTYTSVGSYTVSLLVTNPTDSNTKTMVNYITVQSCANLPVKIAGTTPSYYSTLQAAYDAAVDADTIQSLAVNFIGDLNANRNISVTLKGGYDCGYTSQIGNTMLQGLVTTSTGTLTIGNFELVSAITDSMYIITSVAGAGGSISPSGTVDVQCGATQSYTITTNPGYQIFDVIVDNVSKGVVSNPSFTNITANHTITANFAISPFTITATAGTGGTITPSGAMTVNYGASQTFTITPNTGYQTIDVKVDGVSVGVVTTYTFTNVTASHTITASFATGGTVMAPTNLTATVVSSTQVNLSWTDNSISETGFAIERKTNVAGSYAQIATVLANVTTYTDTSLATNTIYYYRVSAYDAIGYSTYSNEASATTGSACTANGDVNGDGVVDAGDVVLAQRIAMGIVTPTSTQLCRGDVAPAGAPDGVINAADVVVIQRKAMGLP